MRNLAGSAKPAARNLRLAELGEQKPGGPAGHAGLPFLSLSVNESRVGLYLRAASASIAAAPRSALVPFDHSLSPKFLPASSRSAAAASNSSAFSA